MERGDRWLLIGVLLLTVVSVELVVFGGLGVGMVMASLVYLTVLIGYMRVNHRRLTSLSKGLMIPIGLCILCFLLYSNEMLRFLNIFFLVGLLFIQAIDIFGRVKAMPFIPKWIKEVLLCGIYLPLEHIDQSVRLLSKEVKQGHCKQLKEVGKILLGMVIAAPVLVIIVVLLVSSDAAFEGMVGLIFKHINGVSTLFVEKIVVIIILYPLLFSFFYSLVHRRNENEEEQINEHINGISFKLDFTITSTIGTLLCLVYLLYFVSQLAYFVSAFAGILPSDYTFSEYARRGFFETLPLAGLNLLVIIALGYMAKSLQKGRKIFTNSMIGFITAFTLFIVVCAFSKMVMYVNTYGLTLWRVYTSWFLALIILVVMLIVAYIFWQKFNVIKALFILFTIMYLGLNYANVDYIVAAQNTALYEKGVTEDLSACFGLSSSAATLISQKAAENPRLLEVFNMNYSGIGRYRDGEKTQKVLQDTLNRIETQNWEFWNLADYRAQKYIKVVLTQDK